MSKIELIKEEKVTGEIFFKIYIDGGFVRSFTEREEKEGLAERVYEECWSRLKSCKYPKIIILKSDTI